MPDIGPDVLGGADKSAEIAMLRQALLHPGVDTSGGSAQAPVTVRLGIVFCDFADRVGGAIPELLTKILGPSSTVGGSYAGDFVRRESGGRVRLEVATYAGGQAAAAWVRLPGKADDYVPAGRDRLSASFLTAVDALVDFPNDWQVVLFAFPPGAGVATPRLTGLTSWCSWAGDVVDATEAGGRGQQLHATYLGPTHYDLPFGHLTVTHELMHALRLLDLYSTEASRSYGWSIMSAAGAGVHLTGLEKLVLGWDPPERYTFLRGGTLAADLAPQSGESGVKGVVVLPDPAAGRSDYVYLEIAQGVGVGEPNQAAFATAAGTDPGVLVLSVRTDGKFGLVSPVVARRPADAKAAAPLYGGASAAPVKNGESLASRGVTVKVTSTQDSPRSTVACSIQADRAFRPAATATSLRENESLAANERTFTVLPTGAPSFGDPLVLGGDQKPLVLPGLRGTDYGHRLFVTDTGELCLAASVDVTPAADTALMRIPPPTTRSKGTYYFTVEKAPDGTAQVSVYRRPDPSGTSTPELIHTPLKQIPNKLTRAVAPPGAGYQVSYVPDGNVVVTKDGGFVTGSFQLWGLKPESIFFGNDATLYWLGDVNTPPLRSFPAQAGTAPYSLTVRSEEAQRWTVVVTDTNANVLSAVFGRIERGWQGGGTLPVAFTSTGDLTVSRSGSVLARSSVALGTVVGGATSILFENDGRISWLDGDCKRLLSFSGPSGRGPFVLGAVEEAGGRWSLVVKAQDGAVLYRVLGYRLDRWWRSDDGTYVVAVGDDGNIGVSKEGTFVTGSFQVFDKARPRAVTFSDDGTMTWLADDEKTVLRSFRGRTGTGPFRLAVDRGTDDRWSLVVKDVTGTTLCPVLGYRLERLWKNDDGTYAVSVGDDGNIGVSKNGAFITGSFQLYDGARPQAVTFANDGTMTWLKSDGATLRTFAGTAGRGPYTLVVDHAKDKQWDLVVRDRDGVPRTWVFSGLERTWQTTSGEFTVAFGDDGNVAVLRGATFLIGTYQVYEETRLCPQSIAFTTDGTMKCLNGIGAAVRTFTGSSGSGPFTLAVSSVEPKRWDLVVRDGAGRDLALVFGCLEPGWTGPTDANGFQVFITAKGRVSARRNGVVVTDGDSPGRPSAQFVSFNDTGQLCYHQGNSIVDRAVPDRTGRGPFRLAVDSVKHSVEGRTTKDSWDVVVKDADGRTVCVVAAGSTSVTAG